MEIPYIVTPRKDTGLFNSKIAIWLFLASEVMLFGGFFSAYVFLRLGADYPWPERTLPVLPGLINTFVLIASSVTVVFAWASLKMRQWGKFQIYMGITVLCSFIFMGLKGIEYYVKFHHQAVRMKDYAVLEGHLGELGHGKFKDAKGKAIEADRVVFETSEMSFNTVRTYSPWVEAFLRQAAENNAQIVLKAGADGSGIVAKTKGEKAEFVVTPGTPLTPELLSQIKKVHLEARAHNGELRRENLRESWKQVKKENPGKLGWEVAEKAFVDTEAIRDQLLTEIPAVVFEVKPPVKFVFKPRDIREGAAESTLRDGTVLKGKLDDHLSEMYLHYVDALDFRHLVMKAKEKGVDPQVAIRNSWVIKNHPELAEIWEKHQKAIGQLEEYLAKKKKEPTAKDRYRIGWEEMAYYAKTDLEHVSFDERKVSAPKVEPTFREKFFGPDYKVQKFPEIHLPRTEVQFASKFSPAWNTYYAIYFTMTGLHGLHVIGGALVLAYYLFFGRKMYLSNPEWLANRVEVGGLFWHFVDLVWIFLFPILYLM